jgi:hypothetical protein
MAAKTTKKAGKGKAPAKLTKAKAVEALVDAVLKGGRPSLYKPEYVEQAKKLCLLGATDQEMADFFKVALSTLNLWKLRHPEFSESLSEGKQAADSRVVRSLYQQAVGYEQDEVKIFMPANAEKPVYAPFRAKVAPNVTAAIFWLKNRRREDWRDKVDLEHSGSVDMKAVDASEAELVAVALGRVAGG